MTPKMAMAIAADISAAIAAPFILQAQRPVSGGSINTTYVVADHNGIQYFVKLNSADRAAMFEAEAAGLRELAQPNIVRVPQPVCHGITAGSAYLAMEYIDLSGDNSAQNQARLGHQLAQLHRITAPRYGWRTNNTLGTTPQINVGHDHWLHFWREQRLGFQLSLAAHNGYSGALQRKGEKLLADMAVFFTNYEPPPSLLHGDLWSGNYGIGPGGTPVIFDPAVYYGDRETDLAMTGLFGGFSENFYHAYQEAYPLDAGFKTRKILYNLYHILNHLNLFGGSYLRQAEHMMDNLLGEIH